MRVWQDKDEDIDPQEHADVKFKSGVNIFEKFTQSPLCILSH